jgi:hypothetical protein
MAIGRDTGNAGRISDERVEPPSDAVHLDDVAELDALESHHCRSAWPGRATRSPPRTANRADSVRSATRRCSQKSRLQADDKRGFAREPFVLIVTLQTKQSHPVDGGT